MRIFRWVAIAAGLVGPLMLASGGAFGDEPTVDGPRVYRDLADLAAISPRPATSEGAARARDLISERLRQAGFKAERTKFTASAPGGPAFELENVVGVTKGASDAVILLVTHYDGSSTNSAQGAGASCDASGVAVLLEVARQLTAHPLRSSVRLAFFDGHWPLSDAPALFDGLYGSKDLARSMARDGSLARVRAVLLVDHVGGSEFRFANEVMMAPEMRRLFFDELRAMGREDRLDLNAQARVRDDHQPFFEQGFRGVTAVIGLPHGSGQSLD
jgi:Zn-dependent M28 family amino/carboxypeptidase